MPIRKDLRHFYRGPDWEATRAACRDRAEDYCEHCNEKNGDIIHKTSLDGSHTKLILIQCGAAHLNGVAGDDRPENLAWLCRGCHLKHDRGQHRETRSIRKDASRPLIAALEEMNP